MTGVYCKVKVRLHLRHACLCVGIVVQHATSANMSTFLSIKHTRVSHMLAVGNLVHTATIACLPNDWPRDHQQHLRIITAVECDE